MQKKIALTALALAIMAPASIVFAEENQQETTNTQESQQEQTQKTWGAQREQHKQAMENQREAGKQAMENQRGQNRQGLMELQQQKRLEFQDRKENMGEQQCKNIENKIANRINRYENNRQMLRTVYTNMKARLTRLVERLKAAGADTTKLEADLAILTTKTEKRKTDYATFMTTLQDSQTFACGKSEGEFKGKIEEARKVPEIIKADREDIKNFFETVIKADLKAIRETLAAQKETTGPTEHTETTEAPATTPGVQQ